MNIRVGFGYDVHKLEEGSPFWIGGVKVEHTKGAVGHSDADVLIHAICDALLGAANLRDIGYHFSDQDPQYKGISSAILMERVIELLHKHQYYIGNIDATVCLEKPKLMDHIPEMMDSLARIMKVNRDQISLKATTSEKMGFVGMEEGVTAYAVVLISKED